VTEEVIGTVMTIAYGSNGAWKPACVELYATKMHACEAVWNRIPMLSSSSKLFTFNLPFHVRG
jgi:hypothetical protein